jgi:membrane associated rhomboid family serine protease
MSRGADLFVICKNPECQSEVSPYVTECPYCGTRLRKRAPKLEKPGRAAAPRRGPAPMLGRLRHDEIPGIRGESRPYVTGAVIVATAAVWIAWRGGFVNIFDLSLDGPPHGDYWRLLTTQFTYINGVYQFGALLAIAIAGWLLERRHGPVVFALVFLACGVGGAAVEAALHSVPISFGANGAALGLLCAWAVPDVRSRQAGDYYEGDLLAVAVAAAALALLPAALPEVSVDATFSGAAIGVLCGLLLALRRA